MTEDDLRNFVLSQIPLVFKEPEHRQKLYYQVAQHVNEQVESSTKFLVRSEFKKDYVKNELVSAFKTILNSEEAKKEIVHAVRLYSTGIDAQKYIEANIDDFVEGVIEESLRRKSVFPVSSVPRNKPPEIPHKSFLDVYYACANGHNVMMVGPAGSGKTMIASHVADALQLEFYMNGAVNSEYKLLGFRDARGTYNPTPFFQAFCFGGVYLFDEIDASAPQALIALNAAIANKMCDFPTNIAKDQRQAHDEIISHKPIRAHENFKCLASANTYGTGGSYSYIRNKLDAATLDRWVVIDIPYDEDLERRYAGNNNWVEKIIRWRKSTNELQIDHVISMRASIEGARLLRIPHFAERPELVEEMVVWRGLDPKRVEMIKKKRL
ncbi:AAA family ATPase [Jiella mangrovi]|uniref:AAA family ATPase n=1 Tax=Jiella mangrovi TaxID=2821407 RepID=A0ABS4BM64_9HYPH|nr:AAA family ATPase [Jiella mangrovi]MBP0617818.1 AAA family ATPase [Jiella mangrovi]